MSWKGVQLLFDSMLMKCAPQLKGSQTCPILERMFVDTDPKPDPRPALLWESI